MQLQRVAGRDRGIWPETLSLVDPSAYASGSMERDEVERVILEWQGRRFDRFNELVYELEETGQTLRSKRRGRASATHAMLFAGLLAKLDEELPPPLVWSIKFDVRRGKVR